MSLNNGSQFHIYLRAALLSKAKNVNRAAQQTAETVQTVSGEKSEGSDAGHVLWLHSDTDNVHFSKPLGASEADRK